MRSMLQALLAMLLGMAAPHLGAAPQPAEPERVPAALSEHVDGSLRLTVVDLSPRFLDFHAAAQGADADARWSLWKRRYDFAAVPPTPEGEAMARDMLDAAWPRYAAVMPAIRAGASAMRPSPMDALREVADLLDLDRPLDVRLTAYVGTFDDNAFTARSSGMTTVAIPIEMDADLRARILRHEMTHAVHIALAGLDGGWERSIAETMIQEGLAARAVEALLPGRHARDYLEHTPGWLETAHARAPAILAGLEPVLEARDGDTVFRFTMGDGSTGIEREAYLGGWLVVGELMRQGRTLADIARVPSHAMPQLVREALASLRDREAHAHPPAR